MARDLYNVPTKPCGVVPVTATMTAIVFLLSVHPAMAQNEQSPIPSSTYARWRNGPDKDTRFFPIAVWLQDPRNAPKYQALGINLYVGLWKGPTAEQIAELKRHGMPVICGQNQYALERLDEKTIVGWMHGDEPDNAQSLGRGKGYGPPVPPAKIVEDHRRIKANDPTRPVFLNLGQGVAWDGWHGRGVRTNHPEDYPQYVRGGDIVSFDIYPAVHDKPAVAGKLWYVARGVDRLRNWAGNEQIVWNCIECTRIGNPNVKPTPEQVKAEVWMAIIHGSRGIIYFCHEFKPRSIEAGLLADQEMAQAVKAINRQVQSLVPVIHAPTVPTGVRVICDPPQVSEALAQAMHAEPVAAVVKRHQGAIYLLSVRMEDSPLQATFQLSEAPQGKTVEVLGEDRTIMLQGKQFADGFGPYAVHLYRIP